MKPATKYFALLALISLGTLLARSTYSYASGFYPPKAVFTYTRHPDFPLENFVRGDLGVLQRTYARSYLYVAYRYLTGIGLDKEEQQAVHALWKERLEWQGDQEQWIRNWYAARFRVPGTGPGSIKGTDRKLTAYQWYGNCLDDAFRSAINTLEQRIAKFGENSEEVREWIKGQDQVFANCSENEVIPSPVSPTSHPLLQADRTYQIAAAHFYTGNFETAEKMFRDIAKDTSSPWR